MNAALKYIIHIFIPLGSYRQWNTDSFKTRDISNARGLLHGAEEVITTEDSSVASPSLCGTSSLHRDSTQQDIHF